MVQYSKLDKVRDKKQDKKVFQLNKFKIRFCNCVQPFTRLACK